MYVYSNLESDDTVDTPHVIQQRGGDVRYLWSNTCYVNEIATLGATHML